MKYIWTFIFCFSLLAWSVSGERNNPDESVNILSEEACKNYTDPETCKLEFAATFRGIVLDTVTNLIPLKQHNFLVKGEDKIEVVPYYSVMDRPSLSERKMQLCETYFNDKLEDCVSSFDITGDMLKKLREMYLTPMESTSRE